MFTLGERCHEEESGTLLVGVGRSSRSSLVFEFSKRPGYASPVAEFDRETLCESEPPTYVCRPRSVYSATDLAAAELGHVPLACRSAASLGRRLIDPLSEYVKLDPTTLGVGMYQKDVDVKVLNRVDTFRATLARLSREAPQCHLSRVCKTCPDSRERCLTR